MKCWRRPKGRFASSSAPDASSTRGASPLGLPHTLSREPLRRLAPFAWLASLHSLASSFERLASPSHTFKYGAKAGRVGSLALSFASGRDVRESPASLAKVAYANRLRNSSTLSATSRQPASIVSECPRPAILTISVTPSLRFCFL